MTIFEGAARLFFVLARITLEAIMSVFQFDRWQRKAVLFSVFLSLLIVLGCARNSRQLLAAGQKYIGEAKYAAAVIELRNAIRLDPRMVDAHYQLAIAYLGLGQLSPANAELSTVLGLNQNHLDAQLIQGNLLLLQRQFEQARAKAEFILGADPRRIQAEILSANSYAGMIDLNESIQELIRTYRTGPTLLRGYLDLRATPGFMPQPELAEAAYKKALATDTQSSMAHLALANFYLLSERFPEAEEEFKIAITLRPDSQEAKAALAYLYIRTQRLDLA